MIGVILAAGNGTRLSVSTGQNVCKALRKINNLHLIEFALNNLIELKANEAFVVIGKQGDLIKETIGDEYKGLPIHYVCQKEQKGLMNAFMEALDVMECDETVLLQLSDEILVNLNTEEIKTALKNSEIDFYCGVTKEENIQKIKNNFSVETNEDSVLVKCIEKPQVVTNNIKGTGFTIFSDKMLGIIRSNSDKLHELCDCFNYLTEKGYCGVALNVAEREFNINTMDDLREAEEFLKLSTT